MSQAAVVILTINDRHLNTGFSTYCSTQKGGRADRITRIYPAGEAEAETALVSTFSCLPPSHVSFFKQMTDYVITGGAVQI